MVTLYRRPDDPRADELEAALDEMVIAYETETVAADPPDDVPELTALCTDGDVITGAAALQETLDTLRALMSDWNRFQSDACYIENDGSIC
ncbi:MAG: hypothetical protein R6T83_09510 [Salinibacter sp.]